MAAAILGFGLNLYNTLHSNHMFKKGMQMYQSTPFPEYQIPQEEMQNQSIAARMAMGGLPSEQYQQAMNNIGRNENFGLNALQTRGGNVGDINALVGQSNDATLGLDTANAQARLQNEGTLMNVNQSLAGYKDKAYQVNKLQRYLMRIGMASSMMNSGNQGVSQGISGMATAATEGSDSIGKLYNSIFHHKNNDPYSGLG